METEKMLEYTGESKKHLAQLSFKKRCDHDEMCMQEAATTVLSQLDLIYFCILISGGILALASTRDFL